MCVCVCAGKERRWWQWKLFSHVFLLLVTMGYLITLAVVLGSYGALPLLYTVILHVSVWMIAHQVALHALPALRFAWLVDGGFWIMDVTCGGFLLCITSILCLVRAS